MGGVIIAILVFALGLINVAADSLKPMFGGNECGYYGGNLVSFPDGKNTRSVCFNGKFNLLPKMFLPNFCMMSSGLNVFHEDSSGCTCSGCPFKIPRALSEPTFLGGMKCSDVNGELVSGPGKWEGHYYYTRCLNFDKKKVPRHLSPQNGRGQCQEPSPGRRAFIWDDEGLNAGCSCTGGCAEPRLPSDAIYVAFRLDDNQPNVDRLGEARHGTLNITAVASEVSKRRQLLGKLSIGALALLSFVVVLTVVVCAVNVVACCGALELDAEVAEGMSTIAVSEVEMSVTGAPGALAMDAPTTSSALGSVVILQPGGGASIGARVTLAGASAAVPVPPPP